MTPHLHIFTRNCCHCIPLGPPWGWPRERWSM